MYYPKSQIKTNLYTNGGEYSLPTTKETYKGYYYEISTGQKFTGKFPKDGPNIQLIIPSPDPTFNFSNRVENPPTEIVYLNIATSQYKSLTTLSLRIIPQFNSPLPSTQDYQNIQFNRYFCKKNNELRYLEIDRDTYQKLQARDPKIAWDLYTPTIVLWQLKGNKEQVFNSNKGTAILIEQTLTWTGFSQYFQDKFLKYYQSLDISNLYTSGEEFKTQSGQDYVGFYHIHNGTIPMVGKMHTDNLHEVLIPIPKPTVQQNTQNNLPTTANTSSYSTPSGGGRSFTGGGGGY